MKRLFLVLALLFSASLPAQAPVAVPLTQEPHHHLVLENDYVRVFRVSVPAHAATLLHQHDVPYLYVSLGPADVVNAVQGRPEARIVMADGQIGYSPGHFAHIARTDAGSTFDNVTIELLKPQGEPQNICAQVVPGALDLQCEKMSADHRGGSSLVPQFKTGQTTVDLVRYYKMAPNFSSSVTITPQLGILLVILSGSGVHALAKGEPEKALVVGDVLWLLAGSNTTFSNPTGNEWSYLALGFEGTEPLHKY
jgi:hypothetical protein